MKHEGLCFYTHSHSATWQLSVPLCARGPSRVPPAPARAPTAVAVLAWALGRRVAVPAPRPRGAGRAGVGVAEGEACVVFGDCVRTGLRVMGVRCVHAPAISPPPFMIVRRYQV